MTNFFPNVIILTIALAGLKSKELCDPSHCKHEGQCFVENNVKTCQCIGENYFSGPVCSEMVDLCQSNPCQNRGQCVSLVGQFLCRNCTLDYGGLWCDVKMQGVFMNMAVYFNHYGFYSKAHTFLIVVQELGSLNFSVELVGDNYMIDSFETQSQNHQSQWTYSSDLNVLIAKKGIRYYNDLPFREGFYHLSKETFWDLDTLKLTLRAYDTETASQLFYLQFYDILILRLDPHQCVPQLKFSHCSNPTEPLMLDIAQFNNFQPAIEYRCESNSKIFFDWCVYNGIGNKLLHIFKKTQIPLLKIPPYRLWFNYFGEVMSSYSLVARLSEKMNGSVAITEARCFILVLPKPVKALIKGGPFREIGSKQILELDASLSRDFALAPNAEQELRYRWDCTTTTDVSLNDFCGPNISTNRSIQINENKLRLNAVYHFTVIVQSNVNIFVLDEDKQQVTVVEIPRLFIHINCVRNCLRNQFIGGTIHLQVQCISRKKCSPQAKFTWILNDEKIGNEHRCIYRPNEMETTLAFEVLVQEKELLGRASIEMSRNVAPAGGSCSIEPKHGIAFQTTFLITCHDYQDVDSPLSYQYIADDFPVERINDKTTNLILPECDMVTVVICDQMSACVDFLLEVHVSAIPEPENLGHFLTMGNKSSIKYLVNSGHNSDALILIKSLVKYLNNIDSLFEANLQLKSITLTTLLEVEQWQSICYDFVKYSLPLDNRKAQTLSVFFKKFSEGLVFVVKDGEIKDIQLTVFERSMTVVDFIMTEFAKISEPIVQLTLRPTMTTIYDPMSEQYTEFPDFDGFTLERIANWLQGTKELHKCFELLSLQAIHVYNPNEAHFTISHELSAMKLLVNEELIDEMINFSFLTTELQIPRKMVKSLHRQLNANSIAFQILSIKLNPFWWFPHEFPITTDIFYLSVFSHISLPNTHVSIPEPLTLSFAEKDSGDALEVFAVIENNLQMPMFTLNLPPHAAVVVMPQSSTETVLLEICIGKIPRSFQIRHSSKTFKYAAKMIAVNKDSQTRLAHIAMLAKEAEDNFPLTFRFRIKTVECLFWDWNLKDPQWSSEACLPRLSENALESLKCECFHFSAFAGRSYKPAIAEVLGDRLLLKQLSINWCIITFYTSLIVITAGILCYNFHRTAAFKSASIADTNADDFNVEVHIFTGSHWNSTSSANVQIRFISQSGNYSITIHQNRQNPNLKRLSVYKHCLSCQNVTIPIKMSIINDQAGRYPSWDCLKINIFNFETNQYQLFLTDQWICEQLVEVSSTQKLKQTLNKTIESFYNNWYQFQSLCGPAMYTDICCFRRSCVWITQFIVSLCIVAIYYGPTTMETYEEERELYYSLNCSSNELVVLPMACFLSSLLVKFMFMYI